MIESSIDFKFWGFIISVLTFAGVILTAILNKLANDKITDNHLYHIATDVKEIKVVQTQQSEVIKEVQIDIANLKGKQEATEKIIKVSKTLRNK